MTVRVAVKVKVKAKVKVKVKAKVEAKVKAKVKAKAKAARQRRGAAGWRRRPGDTACTLKKVFVYRHLGKVRVHVMQLPRPSPHLPSTPHAEHPPKPRAAEVRKCAAPEAPPPARKTGGRRAEAMR